MIALQNMLNPTLHLLAPDERCDHYDIGMAQLTSILVHDGVYDMLTIDEVQIIFE